MANERIQLSDTTASAIMKLAEGNPGAMRVCAELLKDGESIDPDSALGGLANLLGLDLLGIYGPRIWILYKDRCGCNIAKMIAVLRAVQLGLVDDFRVCAAAEDSAQGAEAIDVASLYASVKSTLPAFDPAGIGV